MVEFEGDDVAAKDVAMHVAAMKPVALSSADVPAELIENDRIASREGGRGGKPAEIVAKMVEGSVQKYLKEVSLLNQAFVKNDKQTVEQMLKAARHHQVKGFTATWWARASRRRSTTSPPRWRPRWPPPRAPDARARTGPRPAN